MQVCTAEFCMKVNYCTVWCSQTCKCPDDINGETTKKSTGTMTGWSGTTTPATGPSRRGARTQTRWSKGSGGKIPESDN